MGEEPKQAPVPQHGPNRSDLDALKDGAALLSAAGNRVAALSLLWSAVAIDPLDLAAHRRLAATLASGGDLEGAADEFARYIEFVLPSGDLTRAMLELTYGVNMLGGRQPMRLAAQKIADAVLALVPANDAALPKLDSPSVVAAIDDAQLTTRIAQREAAPVAAIIPPAVVVTPAAVVAPAADERIDIDAIFATPAPAPAPVIATTKEIELGVAARVDEWTAQSREWTAPLPIATDHVAERRAAEALVMEAAAREPIFLKPIAKTQPAMPAPRLVPKVPFRFCLHPGGDRHWMQLEGGTRELFPKAVRVLDRFENVVEERECLPMRAGEKGHSPATPNYDDAPVAWVVVGVPSQIVAAYEAGLTWAYTFQARVNGEWLALDLVDSGCRLGRVRPVSAS